ncbi:MAG: hypothetical protein ACTHM7_04460 [Ginsengibacter sp.]
MEKGIYYIKIIFLTGILFSLQRTFAQSPTVKTTVDKNDILIGQQIHFKVATSMPDNTYRLGWFSVPDSFGNFVPVIKEKIDSSYSNGNLNFSQQIIITSFDSGRQIIPPLPLSVSMLDGDSTFTVYTDSIPINVGYSPADSVLPFHDIKNIIEVHKTFQWWIWALIALAVIIVALIIVYLIRKARKKKSAEIFESKIPPFEEAMQLLDELQNENLIEKQEYKEYHTRLSDIFKRFLSRKNNINQMYLTTDELLIELNQDLSKEKIATFASSLRMGNAVKFARFIPADFENQKCFSEIKEMIVNIHNMETRENKDGI